MGILREPTAICGSVLGIHTGVGIVTVLVDVTVVVDGGIDRHEQALETRDAGYCET